MFLDSFGQKDQKRPLITSSNILDVIRRRRSLILKIYHRMIRTKITENVTLNLVE